MLENFSKQIRDSLRRKYGKIPSAAFVSIQFNRLVDPDKSVSAESTRRWMRGKTMPNQYHIQALAIWLSLDMNEVVGAKLVLSQCLPCDNLRACSRDVIDIAELVNQLSPEKRMTLMNFLSSLGHV